MQSQVGSGTRLCRLLSAALARHPSELCFCVRGERLRAHTEPCAPGEEACGTAERISTAVLWASAAVYAIDFFVAYVLGPIFVSMDRSG